MPADASAGVRRRGFLGYVGSAVAGAATGSAGGALSGAAWAGRAGEAALAPPGTEVSPYGLHQPGVARLTPPVVETVALDLRAGTDREALGRLLRLWTGDIEALTSGRPAPGDTEPWLAARRTDLTVTVGLGGAALATARVGRPPGFVAVPAMVHDRLQRRWCGGDLLLVVGARDGTTAAHAVRHLVRDAAPFARQRWRQTGSWNGTGADGRPVTGRNLFGQVDGSANPRPGTELFDRTVWIDDGPWRAATTVVVRRIVMHLDAWAGLTRDEQERAVGRRLDDGAPLSGGSELDGVDLAARTDGRPVVPAAAHARLAHPSTNGGARIFRKGANYTVEHETATGTVTESGLVFSSYQASIADQFVPLQRSLDRGDVLNRWTTAIGSAVFAVLPGFERGDWLGSTLLR